jgi:hypothetical protein
VSYSNKDEPVIEYVVPSDDVLPTKFASAVTVEVQLDKLRTKQESITIATDVKELNVLFPDPTQGSRCGSPACGELSQVAKGLEAGNLRYTQH